MYVLNLLFKIKLFFSSIYIVHQDITINNKYIFKHQHSTNILEISPVLYNRILKSKKKQVLINTDIKIIETNKINKPYDNNFTINLKIFHKYYQEFLYISSNYPGSNNFEDIVSKNYFSRNLQIRDLENKKIEEILKQDLLNGKVKVLYPRSLNILDTQKFSDLPLQYIWRKGINKLSPIRFRSLYHNKYKISSSNRFQKYLFQILKKQKFPVFIVVNGFNQIIINQPEDLVNIKQKFGDQLLESAFKELVLKEEYSLPLREAYIFINPIDAMEYYNHIKSQYPKSARKLRLKLFVGNLEEFYKTNRLSISHTQLRLLPDLEEVGKLVTKYQYHKNINFDPKQTHGNDYFQGQPIYFIEPVICKDINSITKKSKKFYFPNSQDLDQKEYHFIFTTYQDAVSAWKKYRYRFPQYSLCKQPKLKVYNMESFLQEQESHSTINIIKKPPFRFAPSQETYKYVKQLQKNTYTNFSHIINTERSLILSIKIWINRILWGMLRWNPPD